MGVDLFSPVSPARVRALVLPVGRIKSSRFHSFVDRLQTVQSIRLGDVVADERSGRSALSPAAFPDGRIYLDISSSALPTVNADLAPFELFRNQMIIIGAVDGLEYDHDQEKDQRLVEDGSRNVFLNRAHDSFISTLENAQDQFPGVVSTHLLVFDLKDRETSEKRSWIPEGAIRIPPPNSSIGTTITTVMCTVAGRFLGELSVYADEVKSWTTVATPASLQSQVQRFDSDRRPNYDRRVSDHSHGSRGSSPDREILGRASPRPASQAFSSPSASMVSSPRPDSPAIRSDYPASPNIGTVAETPTSTTTGGIWKQRAKYASMNANKSAGGSIFPSNVTPMNPEKERNIGKARVGIVLGTLYLMAGRWPDAWREFNEHVSKAKTLSDYIWLASGIERMLICMLLLGSENYSFQVPDVCQMNVERQSGLFGDSARRAQTVIGSKDPVAASAALRKLGGLLGDIVSSIMTYYDRAGTFNGEALPQVAFSEMVLRLVKLQAFAAASSTNVISDHAFQSKRLDAIRVPVNSQMSAEPPKLILSDTLIRAYPATFADISSSSRIQILAGVATAFGALGMRRKRAMIVRDLITLIVPILQQARRAGAAELGIHPSSSLSYVPNPFQHSRNEQSTTNVSGMLHELQTLYGLGTSPGNDEIELRGSSSFYERSSQFYEHLIDRVTSSVVRASSSDDLGSRNLKIDILRESVDFCESLANHEGLATNVALLLRVVGPCSPIDPTKSQLHVTLATEEQVHLVNLLTSVSVSRDNEGSRGGAPRYWDDFILRSVQLVEDETVGRLVEHSKTDLSSDPKSGPFLHDAFAKKSNQKQENIVLAGEPFLLGVVLQNPYDAEIEIESLQIEAEGGIIEIEQPHAILGANRLQEVVCSATVQSPGSFKIVGCRIGMAGCADTFFPIYNDEWRAMHRIKVKDASREVPLTSLLATENDAEEKDVPDTFQMPLTAIQSQPKMIFEGTTLKDASLMLLEGEEQTFQVFLRNISEQAVDFLHVSFKDALSSSLNSTLASTALSRAMLYDVETDLLEHPIFSWQRADGGGATIPPGARAVIDVTVRGRIGVKDVKILVDYAHLGGKEAIELERFFTRQVTVSVNTSVNPSVEIQHFDIVSLTANAMTSSSVVALMEDDIVPDSNYGQRSSTSTDGTIQKLSDPSRHNQALMLLDLRNATTKTVKLNIRTGTDTAGNTLDHAGAARLDQSISPGQIHRFTVPIEGLYVARPYAQIPWVSSQSRRQFVVSTSGESAEEERSARELFLYREDFLKRIHIAWHEEGWSRSGLINMRSLHMTRQHIDALKLEDLEITAHISDSEDTKHGENAAALLSYGVGKYEIRTAKPLRLQVKIQNRSSRPIRAIMRLQPAIASQADDQVSESISRRFIWSGILQRALPPIEPGSLLTEDTSFCILSSGIYEIRVGLEEAVAQQPKTNGKAAANDVHDDDELDEAKILGGMERKIWRMREPCLLRAR